MACPDGFSLQSSGPLPVISPRRPAGLLCMYLALRTTVGCWLYMKKKEQLASLPCLHCHRFFSAEPTKPVLFSWPVLPPVGARGNASQTSNPFARPRLLCFGPFGWRLSLPPSLVLVLVPAFRVRLHLPHRSCSCHSLSTDLRALCCLAVCMYALVIVRGRQTLLGSMYPDDDFQYLHPGIIHAYTRGLSNVQTRLSLFEIPCRGLRAKHAS